MIPNSPSAKAPSTSELKTLWRAHCAKAFEWSQENYKLQGPAAQLSLSEDGGWMGLAQNPVAEWVFCRELSSCERTLALSWAKGHQLEEWLLAGFADGDGRDGVKAREGVRFAVLGKKLADHLLWDSKQTQESFPAISPFDDHPGALRLKRKASDWARWMRHGRLAHFSGIGLGALMLAGAGLANGLNPGAGHEVARFAMLMGALGGMGLMMSPVSQMFRAEPDRLMALGLTLVAYPWAGAKGRKALSQITFKSDVIKCAKERAPEKKGPVLSDADWRLIYEGLAALRHKPQSVDMGSLINGVESRMQESELRSGVASGRPGMKPQTPRV